jgi:hypothetical protein
MLKPKRDVEERLTVRSMLAAIAVTIVDHRVLFQIAVVCLAIVVLRVLGPDDIGRGIDYVVSSAPVRLVGRALTSVRQLAIGGLQEVDQATRRAGATPVVDPGANPSIQPARSAGQVATRDASRPDTSSQRRSINEALEAPRVARAPIDTSAASGTHDANAAPDAPETVLWSLLKDGETIRAELHDQGTLGVDLLLFRNGRLWRRERWADRATARAEADRKRTDLEKVGWEHP